jgi:hypothetical protein
MGRKRCASWGCGVLLLCGTILADGPQSYHVAKTMMLILDP